MDRHLGTKPIHKLFEPIIRILIYHDNLKVAIALFTQALEKPLQFLDPPDSSHNQ